METTHLIFFLVLAANIRQRAAKTGHKISKPVERDVESGLKGGMGWELEEWSEICVDGKGVYKQNTLEIVCLIKNMPISVYGKVYLLKKVFL